MLNPVLKSYCNAFLLVLATLGLNSCRLSDLNTIDACNDSTQMQVCFSPGQDCTQMLVDAIDDSQANIYAQAYSFTSFPIAKALVQAEERGVKVTVLVDKSDVGTGHFSVVPYLQKHGISLFVDNRVAIAHNKVMIFDEKSVETGSFNYTRAAQRSNAENMIIIHNSEVAQVYLENWHKRLQLSQKI